MPHDPIDSILARRIRDLRKSRRLTLDQLADTSGVSRSMISLIERRETSPTATVLNKLADALGVALAALFATDAEALPAAPPPDPVARAATQPVWTDPGSGYVRRQLTPPGCAAPIELVEVHFPPGQTVAFENAARSLVIHQQVWVLAGEMNIRVGEPTWRLQVGDCLAMELGQHIVFHNPGRTPARYLLALTTSPSIPRISA